MITKKDIEKILCENNGEEFLTVVQKSIKPFVIINPKKKAEEIERMLLDGIEKEKPEIENKSKDEYKQFERDIIDYWNNFVSKHPSLSAVIKISSERRKHLKTRFASKHFKDNYKKVIDSISESRFLLGQEKDKSWTVSFDFIIQNDINYVKILEGKYRNKESDKTGIERFIKK